MNSLKRRDKVSRLLVVFPYLLLALYGNVVHAKITPTDVFQAVSQVRLNVESLRVHLNKDENKQPDMDVTKASPREVYAQALTLQLKANQLSYELLGKRKELLFQLIKGDVKPRQVLAVVNNVQNILSPILAQKGLTSTNIRQHQNGQVKTPTDVFKSIIQTNRQLNLLLEQKLVPSDVYIRVQESINYAIILRQQFPSAKIPAPQPLVKDKKPRDVYNRSIDNFKIMREILLLSDIKTMEVAETYAAGASTTPSDVYDMASLVHSEVKAAYFNMKERKFIGGAFYPGKKKPYDVYQQVGVLEDLLLDLLNHVKTDSAWLTR